MTKTLLCAVTLLLACVYAIPVSAQSQMQMNADAQAQLEEADAELNAAYKKVMKAFEDNEAAQADLTEAQRAWLKFVEYHMKTLFPVTEGESPRVTYGSMYPLDFAEAKRELVETRTAQLKGMLDGG